MVTQIKNKYNLVSKLDKSKANELTLASGPLLPSLSMCLHGAMYVANGLRYGNAEMGHKLPEVHESFGFHCTNP